MKIKRIKLKNFKNFAEKEIELFHINFFKGINGSGKTTLALESILFALFGYTPKDTLADIIKKGEKSCFVEIELEYQNHNYIIKRKYPTKISVLLDNKELKFATSSEANRYLTDLFGSRESFMRFRIVDAYSKDADILGQGQASIKKIIFSFCEQIFNNAKVKLQSIKSERERFNKDEAVIYTHYPSEKRSKILDTNLKEYTGHYQSLTNKINEFERDYNSEQREKGKAEGKISYYNSQKNKINAQPKICYACKQAISVSQQKDILTEMTDNMKKLNIKIKEHIESLEMQKEIIVDYKKNRDNIQTDIAQLNRLKMRLEARLKQKAFKYTNRDVLIVKQALEELDKLSSYYLTESIRVLEPIINSILEKIDFKVRFTISDKGKFMIALQREKIEYKYKDLSTGQKLLLQVAFKLAMLMQTNKTGVIIADEGMSSLDSENLQHILSIFENYPYQLLFVIHNLNDVPNNIKVIDLNERKE